MAYIWNPDDYHRHSAAQARWAHELIGKLRLSGSEQVLGLNLFCDMLAFARERFPPEQHPNLRFVEGDMLDLLFEGEFDVAFSNAALHWASVHGRIFSGVARVLRPGGGSSSRWVGKEMPRQSSRSRMRCSQGSRGTISSAACHPATSSTARKKIESGLRRQGSSSCGPNWSERIWLSTAPMALWGGSRSPGTCTRPPPGRRPAGVHRGGD